MFLNTFNSNFHFNESIINSVNQWLDQVVISLNLCSSSSKPFKDKQIHLSVSYSTTDTNLLEDLQTELNLFVLV
ncbi:DUF1415 family protein [Thiomicrorhabdus hydrogeniphila]